MCGLRRDDRRCSLRRASFEGALGALLLKSFQAKNISRFSQYRRAAVPVDPILLETVVNSGAALAALAVAAFAGVQLRQQRQERRERRRAAFSSLYAESWRFMGLRESLKDEDLVVLARANAFDPDEFLPRDWGTVLRLVGEVSAGTAVLAGMAYDMVSEARRRGHMLIHLAHQSPAAEAEARTFEQQVKNGIADANELMEDALRSAPHWVQTQLVTIVDPTTRVGKKVQEHLQAKQRRVVSRRQNPILGPLGRALGRVTARFARWLDPTACP